MKLRVVFSVATILLSTLSMVSAAPGDEVIVVYNSVVPESKAVADHYASRRAVPPDRVWGLNMPTNEVIQRSQYRDYLQQPLLEKLAASGLWKYGTGRIQTATGESTRVEKLLVHSDIRYIVLCWGVPLKIDPDGSINEPGSTSSSPQVQRNEAAVDSELAWLPLSHLKLPISGVMRNRQHAATNAAAFHPTNGIVMVARLDGPTSEIANSLVDKAMQAEAEGMWGRAYFDLRNATEPGMKAGDEWIRNAANVCRLLGFETIVDSNANTFAKEFPMSQIGFYCGWYDPHASGPFSAPKVEFMPGAFAYHLHSFSAATLRTTKDWWVGPLIGKGATASMGCVFEPFLAGTPDMGIFASRFIYSGFSFGEAAYASQPYISWQVTVVGDPLYRPFGKSPDALHAELIANTNTLAEWSHLRVVNLNLAKVTPPRELVNYLESLPVTKQSSVLSEKLGDLCATLGQPSSALLNYEQALKLKTTPLQRVRLRLTLAERLQAQGQEEQAYENYKSILTENPDYMGIPNIYQKLIPMAKKLKKDREARQWEQLLKPFLSPPPTNAANPAKR